MDRIFRWLFGRTLIFILLIIGLGAYAFLRPQASRLGADAESFLWNPEVLPTKISDYVALQNENLRQATTAAKTKSTKQIQDRIAELQSDRKLAEVKLESASSGLLSGINPNQILERKKAEIEISVIDSEIEIFRAAARPRQIAEQATSFARKYPSRPTEVAVRNAYSKCTDAKSSWQNFNQKSQFETFSRELIYKEGSQLESNQILLCRNAKTLADNRRLSLQYEISRNSANTALSRLSYSPLEASKFIEGLQRDTFRDLIKNALFALLIITAIPFGIRILCYFVLAPIAARWPAIRLSKATVSAEFPPAARSSVSISVNLEPGEEALVRQDYLQSSSMTGAKRTIWLLDWLHPFASFASGMRFLTGIRGDGERVTVSSVKDAFAELAMLTIPQGSAVVVRPSALAAVVKMAGSPIRIKGHWRLFSLPAWLTMQLRYFVFHGPAQLVLKGGRGVRVEAAEKGRIVGDGQIIGFSTDLSYSVIRTETFWPYFFGRESLMKDRIEEGGGVVLIEEAPLAGRKGRGRGIEGVLDAMLKPLGI
jgi:hypothetical protein